MIEKEWDGVGHALYSYISSTLTKVFGTDPTTGIATIPKGITAINPTLVKTITTTYTIDSDVTGYSYFKVSSSSGAASLVLPSPSDNPNRTITVERADATNLITLKRNGSESFIWQGNTWAYDLPMNYGDIITVQSNGTNWVVINYSGMGQDNLFNNGGLDFWQRGTSTTFSTANGNSGTYVYTADRIKNYAVANAGVAGTFAQVSAPSDLPAAWLGLNSLRWTASTAVGTGQIMFRQDMEGYNFVGLRNKTVNIGFLYKSSKTGTFSVYVVVQGSTPYGYVIPVTITSANTWVYYTANVTLNPASFAGISTTNTAAFSVGISLSSTQYTTANARTWESSVSYGYTGQTNWNANADTFEITGVTINVGALPIPFTRSGRTLAGELIICQRYYEKSFELTTTPVDNTSGPYHGLTTNYTGNAAVGTEKFMVPKRVSNYLFTFYCPAGGTPGTWGLYNASGYIGTINSLNYKATTFYTYNATSAGGGTALGNWTADAEI